jgi:hypothetical protein
MSIDLNVERSLGTLRSILEDCCERHDQYNYCRIVKSCRALWDRASERAYSKPFSVEHLQSFINEFARLWQLENDEDSASNLNELN